jgi:hypothetical protein
MAGRYYLTPAKRDCRCVSCGAHLHRGCPLVYRFDARLTLCLPCADRDPLVQYRPSLRWEQQRRNAS